MKMKQLPFSFSMEFPNKKKKRRNSISNEEMNYEYFKLKEPDIFNRENAKPRQHSNEEKKSKILSIQKSNSSLPSQNNKLRGLACSFISKSISLDEKPFKPLKVKNSIKSRGSYSKSHTHTHLDKNSSDKSSETEVNKLAIPTHKQIKVFKSIMRRSQSHVVTEKENLKNNDNFKEKLITIEENLHTNEVDRILQNDLKNLEETHNFSEENEKYDEELVYEPNKDQLSLKENVLDKLMFHPESIIRIIWEVIGVIFIIYQLILTPFRICFDIRPIGSIVIFEIIQDFFFIIDFLIGFNTGFYEHGILIMDRTPSIMQYMRTWFILDLLSSFPFSLVLYPDTYFLIDYDAPKDQYNVKIIYNQYRLLIEWNCSKFSSYFEDFAF